MDLAALFSGGKDSTFAIWKAQKMGHKVRCLVTIMPHSEESHLLHHPNILHTALQAESMNIPQIIKRAKSDDAQEQLDLMTSALLEAKNLYSINGIVHGGILSEFQKNHFETVASSLGLYVVTPIWKTNQQQYMKELLESKFEFVISAVSCDGLDDSWLGRKITYDDLTKLEALSEKHKFNLSFEGGEAETFVVNCPLFDSAIKITDYKKHWDGY
ncbi:MAG: diphthine--ammonia ligase, partial [Candidatus Nitrosotenuis sp.]|nr:diphthine--ammonia ligase [Candidatus Nitrosotenuis sp.]